MKNLKSDPLKTMLTITTGFLILYLVFDRRWMLIVAAGTGLSGILSAWLSKKIEFLWMKLTFILSLIVPNIILALIFFIFLLPVAILSRLFRKKDFMQIRRGRSTYFTERKVNFTPEFFENPW
jgi:hypothetical protein